MFQLIHLQETVRIMPSEFGKPTRAIMDCLNQKYPNKVRCVAYGASSTRSHTSTVSR